MERVPKKNPDIIWTNLRGEIVLLNSVSGRYYGLKKVGCVTCHRYLFHMLS